jgi:hypothetical protein
MVTQLLKRFRNSRSGVGWVIGVALISVVLAPFVWFPLAYAWDQVYANVVGSYTFTGDYVYAIAIVQVFVSYIIVFTLIATVMWAIIQAKARKFEA